MARRIAIFLLLSLIAVEAPVSASESNGDAFCFVEAGMYYHVPPDLLRGISKAESGHNPRAVNWNKNGSVDIGHMQINSCWKDALGKRWDYLWDPCMNTYAGAWILKQCMNRYGNSWNSVSCYNSWRAVSEIKNDETRAKVAMYVYRVERAVYGKQQRRMQ